MVPPQYSQAAPYLDLSPARLVRRPGGAQETWRPASRCGVDTKHAKALLIAGAPNSYGGFRVMYCAKHSNEETSLSCGRCEIRICTRCVVHSDVGIRCRQCAPVTRRGFRNRRSLVLGGPIVVGAVALAMSLMSGWLTPGSPQDEAAERSNRGAELMNEGRWEEALAELDKAIELDPNNAYAYTNRGGVNAGLGQYEQAIADLDKAIELDPNLASAYDSRGGAYAGPEQYEQAIADLDKAIDLEPSLAGAYYNRGHAYLRLARYEEAIADLDNAMELGPSIAAEYYARGLAYAGLEQYNYAIADFDRAIELAQGNADFAVLHGFVGDLALNAVFHDRGVAYSRLGQLERAIADFDKATELDPNIAEPFYSRGLAFSQLGRYEEAAVDLNKALSLTSNPSLIAQIQQAIDLLNARRAEGLSGASREGS